MLNQFLGVEYVNSDEMEYDMGKCASPQEFLSILCLKP